jgi:hypothetical protein
MYQLSRAIYRELARDIETSEGRALQHAHAHVLTACESAVTRLATDRHYFARPARTLFSDIRAYFPVSAQARVWHVVDTYVGFAQELLAREPARNYDADGQPIRCRATTRRGTACRRDPLPHNGYCPSHQHLAETEDREVAAIAA